MEAGQRPGALMTADVHYLARGGARVAAAMTTDAALVGWWLTPGRSTVSGRIRPAVF
jgi:hypothetical protein